MLSMRVWTGVGAVRLEQVPGSGRRCLVRTDYRVPNARRSRHEYSERMTTVAVADASSPGGTKGRGQRRVFTSRETTVGCGGSRCCAAPKGPPIRSEVSESA